MPQIHDAPLERKTMHQGTAGIVMHRIRYLRTLGFRRRFKHRRPFTTNVYGVERFDLAVRP